MTDRRPKLCMPPPIYREEPLLAILQAPSVIQNRVIEEDYYESEESYRVYVG